jgi:uncharacterized membrane protein (Fun14 family)
MVNHVSDVRNVEGVSEGGRKMIEPMTQSLINSGMPLAGGGLLGFLSGFALKKILKLAFIAVGLIILLLGFLEYKH